MTDRHVYLESYTMNSTSTTTDFQITENSKQQVISPTVFSFAVFFFPFFKAFEYMFCY